MSIRCEFVPWKGGVVRARMMKPGAKYKCAFGWQECLALQHNKAVVLNDVDGPRMFGCDRGIESITILDWPDHCGPRPDSANPTYREIIENAPSPETETVWQLENGKVFTGAPANYYAPNDSKSANTFLGYLVWHRD